MDILFSLLQVHFTMRPEKIFEIFSNSRYLYRNLIRYMCRRVYKGLLNPAFADGGDAGMNS